MSFWRNLYRVFLVAAAALVAVILVRFFMPKFQEERRLRARLEEARQDVRRTAEQLRELKLKQERLREDPRYVEKIAREDLGLAKPGETVFRFVEEDE
ncbi:MAG: septum formation initiator family protein [Kiritimatiellae bacterium]|nr:septum formation initiator family protein [Kiritimatiellia bacterium]